MYNIDVLLLFGTGMVMIGIVIVIALFWRIIDDIKKLTDKY